MNSAASRPLWIAFITTALASFALGFGLTRHFEPTLAGSTQLKHYRASTGQLKAATRRIYIDLLSGVGSLRQSTQSTASRADSYRQTEFTAADS